MELIESKAAGEELAVQPDTEEAAPVPDLMAALKASLDAVQSKPEQKAAPRKRAASKPKRKTPAKTG